MVSSTVRILHKEFAVLHVLILLMTVGGLIRFYNLTYTGLWLDEIFSLKEAAPHLSFGEVYEACKTDQPPLFFFLLHLWLKLFANTDYAARAFTSVIGIAGIYAIYLLGKEIKDARLGLMAAFITTFNWFHISISIEVRFYALVFVLSTLSYLFFLRSAKASAIKNYIGYVISTSLLLNTHYFGLVVFVSQFLVFILILLFVKRDFHLIIGGIFSGVLVGFSLYHWLPVFLHDLQITSFHVKPLNFRYLMKFPWWYIYDPAAYFIFAFCIGTAILSLLRHKWRYQFTVESVVLAGWVFFGFMIPLSHSLLRFPLFTGKYCTIQVPALFILLASSFVMVKSRKLKYTFVSIMMVSSMVVLFFARPPYKKSWHEDGRELFIMYFTMDDADKKTWNEDWREVAMAFSKVQTEKTIVFSQLAWYHEYYFSKYNLPAPINHQGPAFTQSTLQESIRNKEQIWLLQHDHYVNGSSNTGFVPEQEQLLKKEFDFTRALVFKKSKALLYTRKKNKELLAKLD